MARFNYSGVAITGGTGRLNSSLGGTVLLKNGVVRNYVTPTNPQTTAQTTVRTGFAFLNTAWSALTNTQREAWEAARAEPYWAIQDPFTGTSRPARSGKSLFIQVNYNLLQVNDDVDNPSVITTNPSGVEPTDTFEITSVVADDSADSLTVTYNQAGANEILFIRSTPAVSPGNMRLTSVKSKLRDSMVLGASPAAATHPAAYTGQTGQKVFYIIEAIGVTSGKKRLIASDATVIVA